MKKKLFTLMTLLLCLCSGANAADWPVAFGFDTKDFTKDATSNYSATSSNSVGYSTDGKFMVLSSGSSLGVDASKGLKFGSSSNGGALVFYLSATSNITIDVMRNGNDTDIKLDYMGTTQPTALSSSNYSTAGTSCDSESVTDNSTIYTLTKENAAAGYYKIYAAKRFILKTLTTESTVTYNITFDKNGGTTDGGATVRQQGNKLFSITPPVYAGHVVDGYYKEAGCTNLIATTGGVLQASTSYTDANGKWTLENGQTLYPKWAEGNANTIFSMTSVTSLSGSDISSSPTVPSKKTGTVNATFNYGSSATVYNGNSGSKSMINSSNAIDLGGSSSSYFHASFLYPLAKGDVITSSTTNTFYLSQNSTKPSSYVTFPYTIPEGSSLIGQTDLYVWKVDNGGGSNFTSFSITRPVEGDVNDPTITFSNNTLTLECSTANSTIYYTTDGSEPTTSSTEYSTPVALPNSCTVRAKAFKNENSSEIVKKDCYVTHATALAVLGYNGGTLNSDKNIWTSTDEKFTLTDNSVDGKGDPRTIGYADLAGSQDGFKINHTDTYTLDVSSEIKVTKIVVVGKSWLTGEGGNNASTIAIDGFTPASGTFYEYPTGGETYVKTIEFTPTSELAYGASIDITPGINQLGAYIEVYGDIKTYDVTKGTHANGDFTIATSPAAEGATVTLEATPSSGYEFTSWQILKTSDDSDVTDAVSLSSASSASATFTMPAYGVTVNATFSDARYTVTYNANLGTCATASEKQATSGAAVTLPTPTFTGCTFDGWYNNGTKVGDAGASYTPTADITLYAKWTDNTAGKLFSYIDGNYGNKFQTFDASGWVTGDEKTGKDKTFTDASTGVQFVITKGVWDNKTNCISSLAKFLKGTSAMSIVIPTGYKATVKILYGAYGTGNDYKLTVNGTGQANPKTSFDDNHTNIQIASDMQEVTLNNQTGTLVLSVNGSKNIYIGRVAVILTAASATISSAEYATFCNSTYALDFSTTGITVYTAEDKATSVRLNEITSGQVPANTPVVLYKEGADGTAINVPVIASADAVVSNDLRVSTGTDVPNMFVLAKKNGVVGFYKWAGTTDLSAGKVYLLSQTSGARDFLGFEETTTGINAIDNGQFTIDNNAPMYNLAGQRVTKSYKGVVIVNGKKIVRK